MHAIARSFEDGDTSVVELKKLIFNSLYTWIATHNSLIFSSSSDFMNFYSSFSIEQGILLYTSYVLGCAPLHFSMILNYL